MDTRRDDPFSWFCRRFATSPPAPQTPLPPFLCLFIGLLYIIFIRLLLPLLARTTRVARAKATTAAALTPPPSWNCLCSSSHPGQPTIHHRTVTTPPPHFLPLPFYPHRPPLAPSPPAHLRPFIVRPPHPPSAVLPLSPSLSPPIPRPSALTPIAHAEGMRTPAAVAVLCAAAAVAASTAAVHVPLLASSHPPPQAIDILIPVGFLDATHAFRAARSALRHVRGARHVFFVGDARTREAATEGASCSQAAVEENALDCTEAFYSVLEVQQGGGGGGAVEESSG